METKDIEVDGWQDKVEEGSEALEFHVERVTVLEVFQEVPQGLGHWSKLLFFLFQSFDVWLHCQLDDSHAPVLLQNSH
jgi:hypothetical protein